MAKRRKTVEVRLIVDWPNDPTMTLYQVIAMDANGVMHIVHARAIERK